MKNNKGNILLKAVIALITILIILSLCFLAYLYFQEINLAKVEPENIIATLEQLEEYTNHSNTHNEQETNIVKPIIDEKPAPSLDEVREKILGPVETKTNVEESAMDEASAEEIFAETAKLKDEVQQLQAKDKELSNNLSNAKATYDSVVNASTELEKTLASRREEKQSKKKMFYQVASKQKQMMSDYKENLLLIGLMLISFYIYLL